MEGGGAQISSERTAISQTPNSEVRTITSAVPSPAQSNISLMAGNNNHPVDPNNNHNTLYADESNSNVSLPATPISANVRFTVALCVLITQGLVLLLCQGLLSSSSSTLDFFGSFLTIFISFFSSEWIRIHSFALTRQKRAFFDERNILETYQPRSRTHGHLFQPDPPTPGPVVKFNDDKNGTERSASDKAAFNAMRDAHYENMFEHAARVAKEAEEADRQALEAQKLRLSADPAKFPKTAGTDAAPKGEPLYEDLPANPPTNGPGDIGTKLELPPSLMDKSDDGSSRSNGGGAGEKEKSSPQQKSSKTKGLFFEDHVKGSTSDSTAASSTSTATTDTTSLSTATSGGGTKSGQKRKKNKKL